MNRFFGSFGSYLIAILLIICGLGGFLYLQLKSAEPVTDTAAIDISAETGYNLSNITSGMHVTYTVNNWWGYHPVEVKAGKETARLYYFVDYTQKSNDFKHIITVYVKSEDFYKWDKLTTGVLSPKATLPTLVVDGYTRAMTPTEYKDIRNNLLLGGSHDMDEIDRMTIRYVIEPPKTGADSKESIFKIAAIIAMALGGVFLIGSIIGSVANRY